MSCYSKSVKFPRADRRFLKPSQLFEMPAIWMMQGKYNKEEDTLTCPYCEVTDDASKFKKVWDTDAQVYRNEYICQVCFTQFEI